MIADRFDTIIFKDGPNGDRIAQVMSCRFYIAAHSAYYYYVVEADGTERLVHEFNIKKVKQWQGVGK